jgi:hypothetical protein
MVFSTKIIVFMRVTRLRASRRRRGERGFSEFSVTDPLRGHPAGGGGVQRTGRYTGLDLSTYMNNIIPIVWITSPQNTSENKRREIPVWL